MTQRSYTIEVRIDVADETKYEDFQKVMIQAGQLVYANAQLISGTTKPQIAVFSDDFFAGHNDIDIFTNSIAQGDKDLAAAAKTAQPDLVANLEPEEEFSSELLNALK